MKRLLMPLALLAGAAAAQEVPTFEPGERLVRVASYDAATGAHVLEVPEGWRLACFEVLPTEEASVRVRFAEGVWAPNGTPLPQGYESYWSDSGEFRRDNPDAPPFTDMRAVFAAVPECPAETVAATPPLPFAPGDLVVQDRMQSPTDPFDARFRPSPVAEPIRACHEVLEVDGTSIRLELVSGLLPQGRPDWDGPDPSRMVVVDAPAGTRTGVSASRGIFLPCRPGEEICEIGSVFRIVDTCDGRPVVPLD